MRATTILGTVLAAIVMVVILLSLTYPNVARFGPLVVGIPALIMLLSQILYENFGHQAKSQNNTTPIEAEHGTASTVTAGRYVEIGVWVAILLLITYLVGIVFAFPLFTFAYLVRYHEGWLRAVLISLIVFAIIYGVFDRALEIYMFKGILLE
ncbi:tripartite tricarboxylate transporter TctB family protein [Chloroflexota bacterium]